MAPLTNDMMDEDDEQTRLLDTDETDDHRYQFEFQQSSPDRKPVPPSTERHVGIIITCILLIVLLELGAYLSIIPLIQILEEIICNQFHPDRRPRQDGNAICKENAVQTELAFIRGWQSTLDFIPGVLTAVPYGILADRHGRELVLNLSLLGVTLSSGFYIVVCSFPGMFPPRLTWLSAVFTFIGGGQTVCNAMIFTIINDVVTDSQRSTYFFYLAASVIVGELLASPIVFFFLRKDLVWLSIYLGFGCLASGTAAAFFLPETLATNPNTPSASTSPTPTPDPTTPSTSSNHNCLQPIRTELTRLVNSLRNFTSSTPTKSQTLILALLLTYLFTTLGRFAQELLFQYVTKRYNWSWSSASLLLSVRAFFTLVLFAAILPGASYVLEKKLPLTPTGKDLWLARGSAAFLTIGAMGIGLAGTWVPMVIGLGFFALGSGYNIVVRSLLASVVDKRHIGMLYTAIGILETVGALMAGPLLAFEFRTGMEWEGGWIGLPYLTAGGLFGVAVVVTAWVRVDGFEGMEGEQEGLEGELDADGSEIA